MRLTVLLLGVAAAALGALISAPTARAAAADAAAAAKSCPKPPKPIDVGPRRKAGLGARGEQASALTAIGLQRGSRGATPGGAQASAAPPTVLCQVKEGDATVVLDKATNLAVRVAARRAKDNLTVFAQVAYSPDQGTFQTAYLRSADGGERGPREVGICGLWDGWSGAVAWNARSGIDASVGHASSGWSPAAAQAVPGERSPPDWPDGLWRRLGFANASYGARAIALTYRLTPAELAAAPVDLVIQVTRPGEDPVVTVPFTLRLGETPGGVSLAVPPPQACEPAARLDS